jgi:hypothetical protein
MLTAFSTELSIVVVQADIDIHLGFPSLESCARPLTMYVAQHIWSDELEALV